MPIYEYRCAKGHTFEVMQSMSEDPIVACEECGATVERIFHPVAIHFKGSGFYTTDYAKKGAKSNDGASADGKKDSKEKKKESKKESKDSGKSEKTPAASKD